MAQRRRHCGQQALGIVQHALVQVAGVGVQSRRLLRDGLHHLGLRMADRGHVVVSVQIAPTRGIEQPHTFAAHQLQRLFVEQPVGGAQQAGAARQQGGAGVGRVGHR